MKQRRSVWQRICQNSELLSQPLPTVPLVELAGDRRLLIEHHHGVTEYGPERICVQVQYGLLCVNGSGMELAQMTANHLVITGCIDSIVLLRGGRK